jgi:EAL domain-containing protein (putative c-di-GMP-specific phosphodiesterase class I)
VMGIARTMGLVCVAEGVENAEQLARLADLGCHVAQGFHLARPLPAEEIDGVLDRFWGIPSVV